MTIVTDTVADNWSVDVANPDGRSSARVGFRVNAPAPEPSVAAGSPTAVGHQAQGGAGTAPTTPSTTNSTGLSGRDATLVLGTTTQYARLNALQALMPRIKEGLTGQEINEILGDPKDVARSQMVVAIAAKARTGLPANEAALVLSATTQYARLNALQALMPRIKEGLTGQEINEILGDPKDVARSQMVVAIAAKARTGLPSNEAALALGATTQYSRLNALQALAPRIKAGLTAQELDAIVGDPQDPSRAAMVHFLTETQRSPQSTSTAPTYPLTSPAVVGAATDVGQSQQTAGSTPPIAGGVKPTILTTSLPSEVINWANIYSPFAILSANIYQKDFQIPQDSFQRWRLIAQYPSSSSSINVTGLGAQAYQNGKFLIVVFRGTDGYSPNDWLLGNLPVGLGIVPSPQYTTALGFVVGAYKKARTEGVTPVGIFLTGHSLGGGIALWVNKEVSTPILGKDLAEKAYAAAVQTEMKGISTQAIVFDSSPVTGTGKSPENTTLIFQSGEILEYARMAVELGGIFPEGGRQWKYDFMKDNLFNRHDMAGLACGMVGAAYQKDNQRWKRALSACSSR